MNYSTRDVKSQLSALASVVGGKTRLLIVTHNNPDPDALSSAMALAYLMRQQYAIEASIACRGSIGRAENQSMVSKLKIPLKQFNRVSLQRYDMLALVDGQPFAGNTPNLNYNIVIDHHPLRNDTDADFLLVDPEIGVTATIIIQWLQFLEHIPSKPVCTALAYGISSETQDLGRDASQEDIQAYLYVYQNSNIRLLSQIMRPKLPKFYFQSVHKSLDKALVYRNMIYAYLDSIPNVEIVAEMADFFLRYDRVSWSFVIGKYQDVLILSIRSTHRNARAGEIVKKLVPNPDNVGGHDHIAGGFISIQGYSETEIERLIQSMRSEFALFCNYPQANWHRFM